MELKVEVDDVRYVPACAVNPFNGIESLPPGVRVEPVEVENRIHSMELKVEWMDGFKLASISGTESIQWN